MEHASASTPLLADSETNSSGQLKQAYSDCRLHDKCFLSDGAAKSSESYKKVQRKLVTACILCFVFMAVEVVGGYIAKSVAIMSDAAHMLSDVSAFLVSIFATWAATQSSSWHYSFGYHRAEILGALISVLTIWAVTGALVFEAVQRVINPVKVDGKLMFIIACAGVVFNILIGLTLGVHAHLGHSHAHDDDHGHDHGHAHHHDHDHEHQHDHHDAHAGSKHKHDHSSCKSGKADHDHHHHKHDSDCNGASCNGHGPDHSHHSSGDSSHSRDSEHDHAHDHDHDHGHESEHAQQDTTSGHASPAATAFAHSSVVIDVPADGSASDSHKQPRGGHCTIKKAGSREIEIQYELPVSALPAAKAPGHTHAHDHDHGGHNHGCHSHGSINLRSAVLHVIGDLLQSIGVAIAGGLIWLNQDDPRWHLADPICTFVFSIVVLLTTKSVLKDIINVLMERTPRHINIPAMSQVMSSMDGIIDVHDLHIWNISTSTKPVLTAHVHIGPDADPTAILQQLEQYVRRLGIDHSTIQICNAQRSLSTSLSDA